MQPDAIKSGPHKPKLLSFESAEAIYHEGRTFAVVRISDITFTDWGLEFDPAKIKLMSAKILAIPPDIYPGTRNGIIRAIMSGNYERADDYLRMAAAEKKDSV